MTEAVTDMCLDRIITLPEMLILVFQGMSVSLWSALWEIHWPRKYATIEHAAVFLVKQDMLWSHKNMPELFNSYDKSDHLFMVDVPVPDI